MHNQGVPSEPDAIRQLWGLAGPPARGPRARADVAAVAAGAVAVADRDGFEAVTLARVAAELGLTTTALYRYVDAKATLVELMVDHALGEPPVLRARTPGRRLDAWVDALCERYAKHPWLSVFPLERPPRSPRALAWLDVLLQELSAAGAPDPLGTALAVDVLVRGYAGLARVSQRADVPSPELAAQIARRFPALAASASGGPGASQEGDLRPGLRAMVRRVAGVTP